MQDKPLPISFWGPTTIDNEPAPVQAKPDPRAEFEQWRPAFEALGWVLEDAMTKFYDQFSELIVPPRKLRTPEDVYRHLMSLDDIGEKAEPPAPPKKTRISPELQLLRDEEARVSAEWHQAVRQSREARIGWEAYVRSKKEELNKARYKVAMFKLT